MFEHIEDCTSKMSLLERDDQCRFVDDFPARDINDNRAMIEHRQPFGADQAVSFRDGWSCDNQDIATTDGFVQLFWSGYALDEWWFRFGDFPADGRYPHAEGMGSLRH